MFGWQCMQWGFCHPLRPLCNRCLKACKNCKLSYRKVYFDVTPPPELFSAGIPLKTEELQLCMFHPFFKPVSVTTTASVCKPLLQANWALLFWPTWLAEAVCKPKTFVVTETDFKHPRSSFRFCSPRRQLRQSVRGFVKRIVITKNYAEMTKMWLILNREPFSDRGLKKELCCCYSGSIHCYIFGIRFLSTCYSNSVSCYNLTPFILAFLVEILQEFHNPLLASFFHQ